MKQRFSKKREAIYSCLRSTDTHPTADWIYHQLRPSFPDLSLRTAYPLDQPVAIYRNLTQLKDAGVIRSVGVVAGQERFDADIHPHTHFICTNCDAVLDLMDVHLPAELVSQAEKDSGCSIPDTSLRFTGLCPLCRPTIS